MDVGDKVWIVGVEGVHDDDTRKVVLYGHIVGLGKERHCISLEDAHSSRRADGWNSGGRSHLCCIDAADIYQTKEDAEEARRTVRCPSCGRETAILCSVCDNDG